MEIFYIAIYIFVNNLNASTTEETKNSQKLFHRWNSLPQPGGPGDGKNGSSGGRVGPGLSPRPGIGLGPRGLRP